MPYPPDTAPAAPFSTFYLFATALAAGVPVLLPLVPLAVIGRRFFILMSLIAIVFVALAVGAVGLEIGCAYLVLAALLVAYNLIVPRQGSVDWSDRRERAAGAPHPALRHVAQGLLIAAGVAGIAGVVQDALAVAAVSSGGVSASLVVVGSVASALLLGGSLVAMTLGHWYLVARGLSFAPLARMTAVLVGALALRLGVGVASTWEQTEQWADLIGRSGWTRFLVEPGTFVLARVLFGLVAPVPLLWMARKCVAMRSNQSATGILYVVVAFVLIGEIIARYLLVSRGLLV